MFKSVKWNKPHCTTMPHKTCFSKYQLPSMNCIPRIVALRKGVYVEWTCTCMDVDVANFGTKILEHLPTIVYASHHAPSTIYSNIIATYIYIYIGGPSILTNSIRIHTPWQRLRSLSSCLVVSLLLQIKPLQRRRNCPLPLKSPLATST